MNDDDDVCDSFDGGRTVALLFSVLCALLDDVLLDDGLAFDAEATETAIAFDCVADDEDVDEDEGAGTGFFATMANNVLASIFACNDFGRLCSSKSV